MFAMCKLASVLGDCTWQIEKAWRDPPEAMVYVHDVHGTSCMPRANMRPAAMLQPAESSGACQVRHTRLQLLDAGDGLGFGTVLTCHRKRSSAQVRGPSPTILD